MKKTKEKSISLADTICDLRQRKIKCQFLKQVDTIIDWRPIKKIINNYDKRMKSPTGNSAYEGLLLVKMSLLQTWYGLSDYEVEEQINDRISFSSFCGLPLEGTVPDHSTLSRFRTEMTKMNVYNKLFKNINKQLEKQNIIIKTGALLDASIVETPLKPKGKSTYDTNQHQEKKPEKPPQKATLTKKVKKSVDTEGAWVKKGRQFYYGYKKHVVTEENGLILGVKTTAANVNEVSNLSKVLDQADLPKNIPLKADKGYQSKNNGAILQQRNLKNHIMKKATRAKQLSSWEKKFNKAISQVRYKIERTFGSIKRWFNGGYARYRGIAKMHTQNLLESMCYNLYRSPGIIVSNSVKR